MHSRQCEVTHLTCRSWLSLLIKLPNNVHHIAEMNKWLPNANQLSMQFTCLADINHNIGYLLVCCIGVQVIISAMVVLVFYITKIRKWIT